MRARARVCVYIYTPIPGEEERWTFLSVYYIEGWGGKGSEYNKAKRGGEEEITEWDEFLNNGNSYGTSGNPTRARRRPRRCIERGEFVQRGTRRESFVDRVG